MREIKFRAFDAATKQHWVPKPQDVIYFDIMHVPDFIANTHNEIGEWKRRFTVEQFTGIKDANGVDVYESDITEDHVGIGVVEFCEKYAVFRINYKNGRCKWFYDYTLKGERESITVIGNIHQHAYLLEQNKC